MPTTTKTGEPKVLIIPKATRSERDDRPHRRRKPHLLTVLFSLLALIAVIHFIAVMHQADPMATVTPTTCTGLIRTTDYTQVVHLQPKSQEMGAIQFANELVGRQPAALVQVMSDGAQHTLDVYVFGCTMQKHSPTLTTLFTQHSLIQGTVSISTANTLVIGELDTTISPQTAALMQPLQENVYREYSWHNDKFVQVAFPSLYPVTSRSEAEALQQQANSGQGQMWSDPLMTAEQMAKDIFKWNGANPQDAVLNNNGVTAQVQLIQQNPQMQVTVTLERLIQHDSKGLWFVTGAQTSGITLDQSLTPNVVASPTTVKGTGALADGQTTATLFDHTLTPLSLLNNPTLGVDASGAYTGMLFYNNGVHNQQGVLLVESLPPNGSTEVGQLLLTRVILG